MANNYIVNLIEPAIQKVSDHRFEAREVITVIWSDQRLQALMKHHLETPDWPDVEAYSVYINQLVHKRLRKQKGRFVGDYGWVSLPMFLSVPQLGTSIRLYADYGLLTWREIKKAGEKYLELGSRNSIKGEILTSLADKAIQLGLKWDEELLWKQAEEICAAKEQSVG